MTRVDRIQAAEQTITLRVTPWRSLRVSRDIEMRLDQSLHELHEAIQQAFELDNDHLYAFYMNGNAFDRLHCYDDERCESGRSTRDTWLGQFALPTNKRFLYLFDFGDELRHHVKVVAWGQRQPNARYPRVVAEVGKVPLQYPDRSFDAADEPSEIEELHDDCGGEVTTMAVLSELERQELALLSPTVCGFVKLHEERRRSSTSGATRSTSELAEELASACRLLRLTHGDLATVHVAVEHAMGRSVWGWLCSLPNELADAGMNEGALELAQLVYAAVGEESLRMQIPRFLFRAGKVEEARALLSDNLREFPQEPAALLEAARLEVSFGDTGAAESHYREALEWVGSNLRLRRQLVWGLEELLTTTEQIDALHVLQRQEKRFLESLPSRFRAPKPLRREAPKVGRNDPCPCGSGKKSKKCCARAS